MFKINDSFPFPSVIGLKTLPFQVIRTIFNIGQKKKDV